jgi:SAM-dependent methyltransferase
MSGFDRKDVIDAYDAVVEEYVEAFLDELDRKAFDRRLLDGFAARLVGRGPVCDVGCGPGHVGRYLADRGVAVFGLDLSPAMVSAARLLHPHLPFVQGDVLALGAKDRSWAGAVAFYSLIHLPRTLLRAALAQLRQALTLGAPLLLAMHGGTGEHRTTEFLGKQVRVTATLYSLDELAATASNAGFFIETAAERSPYDFEFPSQRLYVLVS